MNHAERNMHPYSKVHQLRVYICAGWKKREGCYKHTQAYAEMDAGRTFVSAYT